MYGGISGGLQVFINIVAPSRAMCILNAKAMIKAHRNCVKANAKFGRKYKGTFWLDRAAYYRRLIK